MKSILRRVLTATLLCLVPICSACAPAASTPSSAPSSAPATSSSAVSTPATSSSAASSPASGPTEVNSDKGKYRLDIAFTDEAVRCLGRTAELNGMVNFNWTCSGFTFTFTGTAAEATLIGTTPYVNLPDQQAHIAVYVDDDVRPCTHIQVDKLFGVYTLAEGLEDGTHTVRVLKASASTYSGSFSVNKLTLYGDSDPAIGTPPAAPAKQIEFIGDSITCGFGSIATAEDTQYTSIGEDGSQAYAYRTAMAFGADANILSISGYGVYVDGAGYTANILPRYYPYDDLKVLTDAGGGALLDAHKWDFAANPSDAVVIHLGTNDANPVLNSSVKIDDEELPALKRRNAFREAYTAFLKTVRENNPDAYIFCVIGGIPSGLTNPIEAVVNQYKSDTGDQKVSFYAFQADCTKVEDGMYIGHPSAKTQDMMAAELIAHMQSVTGWETT